MNEVLAQLCSFHFDFAKSDASPSLGFGQVWKTMITEVRYAFNTFYFNEVCFPFFTTACWFFAGVVIALQGF